jgi:ribosome-binding protein aMBF1 (putative translation factor)
MIKAYTNYGTSEIHVEGTVRELYADTMVVIKELYNRLKKDNPECAESYKQYVIKGIETAFMSDEEMHDHLMKKLLDVMVKGFEENELIQELKDLKKSENE